MIVTRKISKGIKFTDTEICEDYFFKCQILKKIKLAYCLNCPYNLTDGLVEEIEFDDDYEENTFYQKTVENKMPFYKVGKKLKCCGHLHQSIHKDPQIPIIKLLK